MQLPCVIMWDNMFFAGIFTFLVCLKNLNLEPNRTNKKLFIPEIMKLRVKMRDSPKLYKSKVTVLVDVKKTFTYFVLLLNSDRVYCGGSYKA